MIGVKFNGRLGNQLFQYVFLNYLKEKNPDKSFYFINPTHSYISKYFELGRFHNLTLGSKLYSGLVRTITKFGIKREIYIENIMVPKPIVVRDWTIYKGFFQTDFYIKNTRDPYPVKIKKHFVNEFTAKYGELFKHHQTIVVHIRRTDYLKYGKRDISLPMEYFEDRLNSIENLESYKVLFVSDDIEFVNRYFKDKPNFIYSSNSEIIDFQAIMNANIAIISNSSFAWWAAYMNNKGATIYAPKNWLGFRIGKEHPKRIMTQRFTWCEVLKN